jgi:DNA-binding MarR family transcriptional regulator
MKPIDYRNATWNEVQARVVSDRLDVWLAFSRHGPGTTREIARRSGMDILNLRPRATELYQLGFLDVVEDPTSKARTREGVYVALSEEQARLRFETKKSQARSYQPELSFTPRSGR